MTQIRYIGLKPSKSDNVAGTGLTWFPGQVHEVPDAAAACKLLSYPLVWVDADEKGTASTDTGTTSTTSTDSGTGTSDGSEGAGDGGDDGNTEDGGDEGTKPNESAVDKVRELDALREQAKEAGVDVKGTWGIARLKKAIADARKPA